MYVKWKERPRRLPCDRISPIKLPGGRILTRRRAFEWMIQQGLAEPEFHFRAELVHNKRVDRRVLTEHIADLGGIATSGIKKPRIRAEFWVQATDRLDKLGDRVTPADRTKFEAALRAKVPYTEMPEGAQCALPPPETRRPTRAEKKQHQEE